MNKIFLNILGFCALLYAVDLIYNAITNNNPLNPISTLILIGVILYIIYALFFDKKNKSEKN
ncbi:hypothetical protein [Mammaliicoccus fleurettii]|uniref:hypothetical protein n=1 Tax=Mammaliicoccus fleurettii TaxID=150056 RepID=UPI001AACB14D|nr:hypothetical protein [Mammaliicoccus fleurettii]MBO3062918.1 hypothetical protein [Mammaliicoccus fleurettii]MBW0764440.1 hypothetical protein [Mammaliicoccus fleurettii]MEB7723581.1 hypothetical protein [Mammaliicoccus fleurettii]